MPKNGKKSEKRKKSWNFEILNFQMNFFGVKSKKCIFLRGLKNSFFDVLLKEKKFLAKIHSCPPDFSTCLFFTPLIGLIKKFAQIDKRHLLDEVAWSRLPFPICISFHKNMKIYHFLCQMGQKMPEKNNKVSYPKITRNALREKFGFQNFLKWPKIFLRPNFLPFYGTKDFK